MAEAASPIECATPRAVSCPTRTDLRQPLQALLLLNRILRGTVKDPDAAKLVLEQERSIVAMSNLLDNLVDNSGSEAAVHLHDLR